MEKENNVLLFICILGLAIAIFGAIFFEAGSALGGSLFYLGNALISGVVGYCVAKRTETGPREGFVPREIEAESVIKTKSKEDAVFLDTILTILVSGVTTIEAIHMKLMECGYFITLPGLIKVLKYFEYEGLIKSPKK
jgi:hypothetical protein